MSALFMMWAVVLLSVIVRDSIEAASITRKEQLSEGPRVQISPSGAAFFEHRHASRSRSGSGHEEGHLNSGARRSTATSLPPASTTLATTTPPPLTDIGEGCCQKEGELFSDQVEDKAACQMKCSEDEACIGLMYGWKGRYAGNCKTFSHCNIPLEDCGENGESVHAYVTGAQVLAGMRTTEGGFVDMGAGCCTDPEVIFSGDVDKDAECKDRCELDRGCNAFMTGWASTHYCITASKCGLPKLTGTNDCHGGGDSGVHLYISDYAKVPMFADDSKLNDISLHPPPGICVNKRNKNTTVAQVTCPKGLVNVACNCHTISTAGCGTAFLEWETCKAITSEGTTIEAVARCCNVDWASEWEVAVSDLSLPSEGAVADVTCPNNKTRVGCSCAPQDMNPGCMGVEAVNESSCRAYNAQNHPAGVKALAKCAVFEDQDEFRLEIDRDGRDAEYFPTYTSCSEGEDRMISCQCSNVLSPNVKECWGGSVSNQQCQCWGTGCWVTAICGRMVVPKEDCEWSDWGDWTGCSVSCGKGTRLHTRTVKKAAAYGGEACTGESAETLECEDYDMENEVCVEPPTEPPKAKEEPPDKTLLIVIPIVSSVVVCCCGGAIGLYFYNEYRKRKQKEKAAAIKAAAADLASGLDLADDDGDDYNATEAAGEEETGDLFDDLKADLKAAAGSSKLFGRLFG